MGTPPITDQIDQTRMMLAAIAGHAELGMLLAQYGYDEAALAVGEALVQRCTALRDAAHQARHRKQRATAAAAALREQVELQTAMLAQVVRTLWRDSPAVLEALGMRERRRYARRPASADEQAAGNGAGIVVRRIRPSETRAAQHERARMLYSGALNIERVRTGLAGAGYPEARLRQEQALVQELERVVAQQEAHVAQALAGTAAQHNALAELAAWTARLRGIAAAALAERPDLQRLLGLKPRRRRAMVDA